jgi:hypothetical protein
VGDIAHSARRWTREGIQIARLPAVDDVVHDLAHEPARDLDNAAGFEALDAVGDRLSAKTCARL